MKILNLYCGIGGNRKHWKGKIHIDAVENNNKICDVYSNFFPKDNVICGDAHNYLLENFDKYDFIWSSPPCPTHSQLRQNMCVKRGQSKPVYPEMKLYEEIIFLRHNFKGKWVVENTKPYYDYLIKPTFILGRHPFWSNFKVLDYEFDRARIMKGKDQKSLFQSLYGINIDCFSGFDKRKALRNCVDPKIGEYIFNEINKGI